MIDSTHIYIGPDTKWGLRRDSPCTIVGKRTGGKVIQLANGRQFLVAPNHLRRLQ